MLVKGSPEIALYFTWLLCFSVPPKFYSNEKQYTFPWPIISTVVCSSNIWIKTWKSNYIHVKLEQLEHLRSEDTPRRLMITHTIESCWIPSQNKVEWPWIYRSRSKVITCNTPSHASNHLYQIWKESTQNYRRYRADTIFNVKAEWPWK